MSVEIRKNTPPPAPPATYDLLGLSSDQVILLRDVVGLLNYGHAENMDEIWQELKRVTDAVGKRYDFAGVDSISRPGKLGLINLVPITQ